MKRFSDQIANQKIDVRKKGREPKHSPDSLPHLLNHRLDFADNFRHPVQ